MSRRLNASVIRAGRAATIVAALAAVVTVSNTIPVESQALLTARRDVPAADVRTATVALSATPASAVLVATDLRPGDVATAALRVANDGTVPLRYAVRTTSTDPDGHHLADQLRLDIRVDGSSCTATDGTLLYAGPLATAAVGDPASGAHAGDRALAVGASDTLCLRLTLPTGTPASFEHSATATTIRLVAEQTTANP